LFPAGTGMGFFSLPHHGQTGSEAHPAVSTKDSFPRSKAGGE